MQHIPGLYVGNSDLKGRGVFSAHDISKGDIIEICPLILIPSDQINYLNHTILHDYYFSWPGNEDYACIALGYGSLYNHSSTPNADVTFDLTEKTIVIKALDDVPAHEELLIDYQGGDKKSTQLWFDAK